MQVSKEMYGKRIELNTFGQELIFQNVLYNTWDLGFFPSWMEIFHLVRADV